MDDRGVIYVRHGEPAERLRPFVFGLMPNETWHYARAEGDLLFHFSSGYDDNGGGDLYDYRLVESVNDLRGAADAPIDQLLLSRQSISPLYGRMLNWGPYGRARSRGAGARDRAGQHRHRHDHRQLRAAVRPAACRRGGPHRRGHPGRREPRPSGVRPRAAGNRAGARRSRHALRHPSACRRSLGRRRGAGGVGHDHRGARHQAAGRGRVSGREGGDGTARRDTGLGAPLWPKATARGSSSQETVFAWEAKAAWS